MPRITHTQDMLTNSRYLGIESDSSMYHYVGCLNLPSIEGIGLFRKTLQLENSWGTDPHPATPSHQFHQFLIETARYARAMVVHGYPFSVRGAIDLFSNQNLLNIAVLEIGVGKTVSDKVVEHMKSYSLIARQIKSKGEFLGWCYDQAGCSTFREIITSFDIDYHTWLHPSTEPITFNTM